MRQKGNNQPLTHCIIFYASVPMTSFVKIRGMWEIRQNFGVLTSIPLESIITRGD